MQAVPSRWRCSRSRPMCGVIMSVYYAMDRMSTEVPEGYNGLIGNIP